MLIQCTKALLDKIGIKGSELASPEGHEQLPDSLMAWHANFVSIDDNKRDHRFHNKIVVPLSPLKSCGVRGWDIFEGIQLKYFDYFLHVYNYMYKISIKKKPSGPQSKRLVQFNAARAERL